MQILVCEKLKIKEPTNALIGWCKNNLVIQNPEYYKRQQMGKWTGGTSEYIWMYERVGDELHLPFGCLQRIWHLWPVKDAYKLQICPLRHVEYKSRINLYEYQEKAVNEAIKAKNGVLVMPCGSGKTQCGLEIIARIGGRALWLTHTHDLLMQSKERAISVLEGVKCGTITAGKVDIGEHITFATVQTMAKIDLSAYRDAFDIIIVDECAHCAGTPTKVTQFYKVVSSLCARYKFGLTATPKRADGLQACMFALLGDKIHEVTKEEVAHTTCPVQVQQIDTGWMPDYDEILMGDGTIDYHKVIDNMIHDDDRFNVVMETINALPDAAPVMVLANRVEYLQDMRENYEKNGVCLSGMGQSKKAKAERKAALEKLNNGELDCVFCTYQLAAEGLDVPNLKYVVFATPEKDPTRIQQASGRVGRKAPNKDCGIVIDFVDAFDMYQSWKKKREAVYKKLGYDII
jgi:superfamily II DNA or RNA helicase